MGLARSESIPASQSATRSASLPEYSSEPTATGPRGFYVGYASNYAYAAPVDSAKFLLYEAYKARPSLALTHEPHHSCFVLALSFLAAGLA